MFLVRLNELPQSSHEVTNSQSLVQRPRLLPFSLYLPLLMSLAALELKVSISKETNGRLCNESISLMAGKEVHWSPRAFWNWARGDEASSAVPFKSSETEWISPSYSSALKAFLRLAGALQGWLNLGSVGHACVFLLPSTDIHRLTYYKWASQVWKLVLWIVTYALC